MKAKKYYRSFYSCCLHPACIAQDKELKPKWLEFHGYLEDLVNVSFGGSGDSLSCFRSHP